MASDIRAKWIGRIAFGMALAATIGYATDVISTLRSGETGKAMFDAFQSSVREDYAVRVPTDSTLEQARHAAADSANDARDMMPHSSPSKAENTSAVHRIASPRTAGTTLSSATTVALLEILDSGPLPQITGLNPTSGPVGTTVIVGGTAFNATPANNTVKFNGVQATVTSASTTTLQVTVPTGATTGPVTVTTADGTSNGVTFTVQPKILSLSPTHGPVGTSVVITGTTFNATPANNKVKFNGVQATVTSANTTTLQVTVPTGATTGVVTVTTADGVSNGVTFTVEPQILSLSPTHGPVGTAVVITGTTFNATPASNTVKFNGVQATVTSASTTSLQVTVPTGATSGPVTVTTDSTSNGVTFTVEPHINSLSPTHGPEGTSVTITGTTFKTTAASNTVKFNGVQATVTSASTTSLQVTVPTGATSGPVTVTTDSTSNGVTFTVEPHITSLSPTHGPVGTQVTITGTTFNATPANNTVKFNGVQTTVTSASTTLLQVTVPTGATSGPVTVTTDSTSNGVTFTVEPKILSLSPTSGDVGTPVTITGTTFAATPSGNTVKFGGNVQATVGASSTTSNLYVTVPVNAQTGQITVSTSDGASNSSQTFTVLPPPNAPTIVSVPPSSTGTSVTVTWSPSGTGSLVKYYQVQRGTSNTGPWTTVATNVVAPASSYTDTGVPGGIYYYEVDACNGTGCSAYTVTSGAVTVSAPQVTLPPMPAPVDDTAPTHDAKVGTMAGQAGTDGGAATYTVPITVPPGRAGMQPTLSLNYNSRSGNGVLGVGWSIGGLSSIHRCPQTLEQDGQTLGVSYTAPGNITNDRLCLDGQRLVPVSGNYGIAGTVYKTEIDSYARITQIAGSGLTDDTACFRVEQKDGRVLHYGGVTSSTSCAITLANNTRVKPKSSTPLSWLVEKIEDRVGNNQLYYYTVGGNGENLIQRIEYTGFNGTSNDQSSIRSVNFAYQPRTSTPSGCSGNSCANDVSSSYLAGGLTMQTQALQSITTKVGATTVRTYTPTYNVSQYSGRLLTTAIEECATSNGATACHPKTQFVFNDDPINTSANFPIVSLQGFGFTPSASYEDVPFQFTVLGDLDNDGSKEVGVTVHEAGGGQKFYLAQMTGDRQIHTGVDISSFGFGTLSGLSGDIDGSGRTALVKLPTSGTTNTISFGIWNLARGAIADPGSNPFDTVASDVPYNTTTPRNLQNQTVFAADMDGDGQTDLLVVESEPNGTCGIADALGPQLALFLYKNAGPTPTGQLTLGSTAHFTKQATHLFCLSRIGASSSGSEWHVPTIDHIADFDGDGLPDIYLVNNGTDLDSQTGSFYGIYQTSQSNHVVTSTKLLPLNCDNSSVTSTTDECNWQNGYFAHWIDVNGDGLEDFVIARPYQQQWQIRLNLGGGTLAPAVTATAPGYAGLDAYPTQTASSPLHGSGYKFRYLNRLPEMDVDGDGKPEILVPQSTTNNTATDVHGFALKMCIAEKRTLTPQSGECPSGFPTVTPPSTTGPSVATLQCAIYICPEDPGGGLNLPDNADYVPGSDAAPKKEWNGLPAYGAYGFGPAASGPDEGDNSIYHLAALKFAQSATGAFSVSVVNTPMVSRLSDGYGRAEDLFGDGLTDLTTAVGCQNVPVTDGNWSYPLCSVVGTSDTINYGPTTFPDIQNTPTSTFANTWALYGNINQGVAAVGGSLSAPTPNKGTRPPTLTIAQTTSAAPLADLPVLPGLIYESVNGVGDAAYWSFATLSVPAYQDGINPIWLYNVPATGGYVDSRHYYFQSSMPVVAGMAQSTGIGTYYGSRSMIYGYAEAMYNHNGRGFQGFHTITAESGDDGANQRNTRTITTFNQKFPLTGKVDTVKTQARKVAASTTTDVTVQIETDNYVCNASRSDTCTSAPAINTVYAPVLDTQTINRYDLGTGALYARVSTVNVNGSASGWDAYGNLTYQTVTHSDQGSPLFLSSTNGHVSTTSNTFDPPDTTNWWVNKLTQSSVTTSIAYDSTNHALPSVATAPSQTVTIGYTWNADRTPLTKTVQPSTVNPPLNQQSTTTYTYPSQSYGLPTQVQVNAPDLIAALSPTRTTKFTYTKDGTTSANDGYFVLTTQRDPINTFATTTQTTTTTHQTSDGQVLTATGPNAVEVATSYDAFGRATLVQHFDNTGAASEPDIHIAYTSCTSGSCGGGVGYGEDAHESYAAYRITSVQAGHPTRSSWFDLLGREVKSAERGYDGTYIETLTNYDALGTIGEKFSPFYKGSTPSYWTSFLYDALNRPTVKTTPAAEMSTDGDFVTAYTYSGRTTTIFAHAANQVTTSGTCKSGAGNLCIIMTRSQNALGQYMQTQDANGRYTNFWTEPLGHVVAIKDAEGNITTASYNALGQRLSSNDPDQGYWTFTYDALGEILTQTDARSVTTTINQRDALGRTLEQQQKPATASTIGFANESVLDDFSYDNGINGIGQMYSATRRRGSGATVPAQTATPTWSESYTYDYAGRSKVITTTINEGSNVNLTTSMTYDSYGRPDTRTYPSGLQVQTQYGAYGHPGAIANKGTNQLWWEATVMDAWGKVTTEKFVDGTVGTIVNYQSSGQESTATWTLGGNTVDSLTYKYDSFGNLKSQSRYAGSAINTETYIYDALQRLTSATPSANASVVNYSYSDSGNLLSKSDFGTTYSYAAVNGHANGCGPHAPYSVALAPSGTATYNCDANGNVYGGALTATFDADNHPRTVIKAGGSETWAYDAHGQRDYESTAAGTRYFGPAGYEQTASSKIHELGPIVVTMTGSNTLITSILRDRLGSTIDAIDGGIPNTGNTRVYDAFGAVRNGDMSVRSGGTLNEPDTIHGFTQHEHADAVQLIHMGGRIYDYALGRFLSVDPIIGNPLSSQSLNPYSYIGNNPLSGVDPTGYSATRECVQVGSCMSDFDRVDGFRNTYLSSGARSILSNGHDKTTDKGATSTPLDGKSENIGTNSRDVNGLSGKTLAQNVAEVPPETERDAESTGGISVRAARERGIAPAIVPAAEGVARGELENQEDRVENTISSLGNNNPVDQAQRLKEKQDKAIYEILHPAGYGVGDPPSRFSGPWTQRDLERAAEGKGPLDFVPTRNAAGKEVPLELHHAGQMPGSAIHEAPPFHSKLPGLHPNQYNQGVTPSMRGEDAELHWQMRGQEMGNPPPGG